MFWNRDRLDEDIRRIREANLPREKKKPAEAASQLQKAQELTERVGAKDIFAMIIAIFSLILPYVFIFICAIGLVIGWFLWWAQ